MSASRQRIVYERNPTLPSQTTPEQRYWRSFTNSQLVKEHNSVTNISFDLNSPHDFAVTSSTRVQIFSSKTRKVAKNYTRFKDTVYSGEFRQDGKLLIAGDALGNISIFDTKQNSKNLLISFQPTSHPVHITKFHPYNQTQILTCSDDRIARLYDISNTKKPLLELNDHNDYIRSGCFINSSTASPNLIVTGSYDNFIRIFDSRIGSSISKPILKFNNQNPVEDIISLNSTNLVSCGGNTIKTWDLTAGKNQNTMINFSKTVTCLTNAGERGLLAGSIDGHVKVFDTSSFNYDVKFGWKFGSGVLAVGVSPNHKHFVVGLNSGLLAIKTRKTNTKGNNNNNNNNNNKLDIDNEEFDFLDNDNNNSSSPITTTKSSNFKRMLRGAEYSGEFERHVLDSDSNNNNKKLKQFEKDINSFKFSEALDTVLISGVSKEITITCLEEIKKRGKIRVSLSDRDENTLEPLLSWCLRQIDDSRNLNLIADYLNCCIEIYSDLIENNSVLLEILLNIRKKLDLEIYKANESQKILGMLNLLSS